MLLVLYQSQHIARRSQAIEERILQGQVENLAGALHIVSGSSWYPTARGSFSELVNLKSLKCILKPWGKEDAFPFGSGLSILCPRKLAARIGLVFRQKNEAKAHRDFKRAHQTHAGTYSGFCSVGTCCDDV